MSPRNAWPAGGPPHGSNQKARELPTGTLRDRTNAMQCPGALPCLRGGPVDPPWPVPIGLLSRCGAGLLLSSSPCGDVRDPWLAPARYLGEVGAGAKRHAGALDWRSRLRRRAEVPADTPPARCTCFLRHHAGNLDHGGLVRSAVGGLVEPLVGQQFLDPGIE
jgi:hypothetical protein